MFAKSKSTQFVVASALALTGLVVPASVASASVAVAPNGTQVALGQSHVVGLDSTGKVWTWGRIYPGNGGSGTWDTVTRPEEVRLPNGSSFAAVSVAAAEQSTLVATTDGDVYAWGYNGNGLGNGSGFQAPRSAAVKVSFPAGVRIVEVSGSCGGYLARSDQGAVYQWGYLYGMWSLSSATPSQALGAGSVTGDSDKKVLARSCSSAFALKSDGSFYAWGSNGGGKLGNSTTVDSATPVTISIPGQVVTQISASSTHTLARTASGYVYGWGGNANGQLARNPSSTSFLSIPTRIGTISDAASILASDSAPYSSLVSGNGSVMTWGSYFGNGSDSSSYVPTALTPPSDLATQIVSVVGYQNGQAFVGQDGSVWSRGLYASDGNCGADANSWSMWVNGRMQTPRTFVRVFSSGQFGSNYVEDQVSINSLKTSSGASLGLDGSGVVTAFVGDEVSLEAARPSSQCFSANELEYTWDLDGDGIFSDDALVSTDEFGNPTVTGSATLSTAHSRSRGGLRIANPDGFVKTYPFDVRVVARPQNSGNVDSQLPYVSTLREESSAGVAVGTNGKLYAWASADISPNGSSRLPTQISTQDTDLTFTRAEVGRSDKCEYGSCGGGRTDYAVALSTSGEIYVWGTGALVHPGEPGDISEIDDSRSLTPTKVSSPIPGEPVVEFLVSNNRVIALTSGGNVWQWGRSQSTCSNICVEGLVGPEVVTELSGAEGISQINDNSFLYSIDGDWTLRETYSLGGTGWGDNGVTPIPTMLGASKVLKLGWENTFVGLFDGTWKLDDGSALELPPGIVVDMRGGDQLSALMTDGSIWRYEIQEPNQGAWWKSVEPGKAARFSGAKAGAWEPSYISSAGQIINAGGTCVGSDWGGAENVAMFSDGNLGPASFEDGHNVYLTATDALTMPLNQLQSTGAQSYRAVPFTEDQNPTSIRSLHLRSALSKAIEITIGSDCVPRTDLEVKVDLDDDGIFEQDLALDPISSESAVATQWGYTSGAKRGQDTVSLDFSNAGGRYIGVQVKSKNVFQNQDYVSTVRLPIVVEPVRPSGRYSGISINRGAEFTESADVKLGLVWPAGAVTADISNDGGFEVARNVPLSASVNWRLSDLTSGKVGSSVYVKFLGLNATVNGSWQETDIQRGPAYSDNITMDLTPPVVSSADASITSGQSNVQGLLQSFSSRIRSFVSTAATSEQIARISFDASDAGSGVTVMQVTSDPAVPGSELPYQTSISMPVEKDTVVVRVKDAVGNWSAWKYVKISGFRNIVPVTPTPTPSAPSNPTSSPAPTETSRPVVNPPSQSTPAGVTPPLTISLKAKVTTTQIAKSLKVTVPAKAKLTITVAKSSKAICKVVGGKLVAIKPGNCNVTLAVQGPKKAGKLPMAIIKSGKVVFKK